MSRIEAGPATEPVATRHGVMLTAQDLIDDLVWPKLFQAGSLALGASRLGLALFGVVLARALWALGRMVLGPPADPAPGAALRGAGGELAGAVAALDAPAAARGMYDLFIRAPVREFAEHPAWATLGVLVVTLLLLVVCAIARSAAVRFATGREPGWEAAVAFALGRWRSVLGAVLAPVLLVLVIAGLLALFGLVFLQLTGLNVVGGLLYPLALLLGLLGACLMGAVLVGHPLLVPAVACNGADTIDAVQRAGAYVLARPLRVALYAALLAALGLLALFAVAVVLLLAVHLTGRAGQSWSGPPARQNWTDDLTAWLVGLWSLIPLGLLWAYALSYWSCASTLLYLAVRRAADGQEMRQIAPARGVVEAAAVP